MQTGWYKKWSGYNAVSEEKEEESSLKEMTRGKRLLPEIHGTQGFIHAVEFFPCIIPLLAAVAAIVKYQ